MNFLFWNIRGRSIFDDGSKLLGALSSIIQEEAIDVIALAEYQEYSEQLDELLVRDNRYVRIEKLSAKEEKVDVFFNPQVVQVRISYHGSRSTALGITSIETGEMINGYFCHLRSKLRTQTDEQCSLAEIYMEEVIDYEQSIASHKTFICGDFNMCPYENGMVKARAFNTVMDSKIAKNMPSRGYYSKFVPFYNPMWGLAGDHGNGEVPGTYYYKGTNEIEYFWYLFDQVIMRPDIIPYFDKSNLHIVARAGEHNLLNDEGTINLDYSDHLPICFTFNF